MFYHLRVIYKIFKYNYLKYFLCSFRNIFLQKQNLQLDFTANFVEDFHLLFSPWFNV